MSRKEFLTNWGIFLFGAFWLSVAFLIWTLYYLHQNWDVMEQSFQDNNAAGMFGCMALAVLFVVSSAIGWLSNHQKLKKLQ